MKKVIFSLAILAASTFAAMATPANPTASNTIASTEQTVAEKSEKSEKSAKVKGERKQRSKMSDADKAKRNEAMAMKRFDGLDLTDAQKQKLTDLHAGMKKEKKSDLRADAGDTEQKARADRKREDWAKRKVERANKENAVDRSQLTDEQKAKLDEMKARRNEMKEKRKESRANYLSQVKQILTPEQYTLFLENNVAINGDRKHAVKSSRKGRTMAKAHRSAGIGSKQMKQRKSADKSVRTERTDARS